MLQGKKILLGVAASIAAYKSVSLVRLLVKEGAEVQMILTPPAKEFVSTVTLSALSGNPVLTEFFSGSDGSWNSHVEMGIWADLFLIAPVTASTMGKMVNGIADNLLIATYLSAKCPVILAPAMDLDMYQHPSTKRNLEILRSYGNQIIEPATGELASGLHGKGRMQEPEEIIDYLNAQTGNEKKAGNLSGLRILITAGPTHEPIDPVRYVGNHSSGKMGYALARKIAEAGASVILVSGPTEQTIENNSVTLIKVQSAAEMYESCMKHFPSCNVGIMAAAVADYTIRDYSDQKIKKKVGELILQMKPTRDIAAELGRRKTKGQILVGFALETENELENARKKLERKNFDFLVLNSLNDEGAGFGTDTNKITIIDRHNITKEYGLKDKSSVAGDIINKLMEYV